MGTIERTLSLLRCDETLLPGAYANCFAAHIAGMESISRIVEVSASGEIEIANRDYDYSLPLIIARRAGDAIVWFANRQFAPLPPFDRYPVIAFERESYLAAIRALCPSPPPLATSEELSCSAEMTLQVLPDYTLVEYCISGNEEYEHGKSIWQRYLNALQGRFHVSAECEALRRTGSHRTLEIGFSENREILLEVIEQGVVWFRLIEPDLFPIWISGPCGI